MGFGEPREAAGVAARNHLPPFPISIILLTSAK